MAKPIRSDLDFESIARILNLPTPTADAEAATKAYVDALIEGLAWKTNVRVASTANVNLASPGASIDSISLSNGDRVLLKDQTSAPENGIYIWNGAASPMTRSTDAATADDLESAVVTADEGTSNGGTTWRQESVNFTIDVGDVVWGAFGATVPPATESTPGIAEIASQGETDTGTDDTRFVTPLKLKTFAGRGRGATATIGDGGSTQFDVTHNWGTFTVHAEVWELTGNRKKIDVEISTPDNNTVRVNFASAPSASSHELRIREVPTS